MRNPSIKIQLDRTFDMTTYQWVNVPMDILFYYDNVKECWVKCRLSNRQPLAFFLSLETAHPDIKKIFYSNDTHVMSEDM